MPTNAAPRVLALAGSTRRASLNKQLVRLAASHVVAAGGEVDLVDLADHPLPLFDQDLEDRGRPPQAAELKRRFAAADGLLLACPEYNSSITGVLKNAIDWISRADPGEAPLIGFRGKVVALLSASPGAFGGMRGLVHVRSILGSIGCLVLPDQLCVPQAHQAFTEDGGLRDERLAGNLQRLCVTLVDTCRKLGAVPVAR